MKTDLDAGREMDKLVAEKVMDLHVADPSDLPLYSTDANAALTVVEEIAGWSYDVAIDRELDGRVIVGVNRSISGDYRWEAIGNTVAHAICCAMLKAVGIDEGAQEDAE